MKNCPHCGHNDWWHKLEAVLCNWCRQTFPKKELENPKVCSKCHGVCPHGANI